MNKIKKLEWDSTLFGYNVGKLDAKHYKSQDFSDFKLTYLYSDRLIDELEGKLVDKKAKYLYNLNDIDKAINELLSIDIEPFNSLFHDYNELLSLTYESGIYSRFYTDKNFAANEFKKLYKIWIDSSLKKENALNVYVAREDKSILGFVTLVGVTNEIAAIGLIAVSSQARGRKIATNLIHYVKKIAVENNFKQLQVVTQLDNAPAKRLYESNGFKLIDLKFIYHIWNNDTI